MDDLIERAQRGEKEAVDELLIRYQKLVRSVVKDFCWDGVDNDDLLQEGMLGLYAAIVKYDKSKGPFHSFVTLCVKRRVINEIRKNLKEKNDVDISEIEDIPDDRHMLLSDFLRNETVERMRNIIETKLSPFEKQVTELFIDGYSYRDIAEKLGKTQKSVDGALQRARNKISKNICEIDEE